MPATAALAHDELEALRGRLTGTLARPGEPGYELATPWNVAVPMAPRAVVAAATATDVQEAVRFANEHGLRVAVQATGHGAVAFEGDDVLLVHTRGLDELAVDPETRIARIGAGLDQQAVMDAAAPHGLAPLVGSSPAVGVVGYVTGGGTGPLARTFGLTCERVVAFEVVTGDGEALRATREDHPEVFGALCGGKHALGIVTALEMELVELADLHGGALYFDGADAAEVLHLWRRWAEDLPEHTTTSLAFLQLSDLPGVPPPLAGRLTVAVRVASVADDETCLALLAPLRAVAEPIVDVVGRMEHGAIAMIHADPTDPMPSYDDTATLTALPAEAADAVLAAAGPGSGSPQIVVELRHLGGAISRSTAPADAFGHRDAAYGLLTVGVPVPPVAELVHSHARDLVEALAPWSTGLRMPNFGAGSGREAYDDGTRAWLRALAERHDPAGVLRVGVAAR